MKVSIPPWFDFAATQVRIRLHLRRRFQSHLGSILPRYPCRDRAPCARFQSHLGSILPRVWKSISVNVRSFNPTLVRFCPESELVQAIRAKFRFNPTLVRFCRASLSPTLPRLMVSIPPWFDFAPNCAPGTPCADARFNPTLVRFCRSLQSCVLRADGWFQSHLGSILPLACWALRSLASHVSIPPWFDFARDALLAAAAIALFQSHLGSILPILRVRK